MTQPTSRASDFSDDLLWEDCDAVLLPFEFGGASQRGRLQAHTNNQDALAVWSRESCLVCVVCDGCGSSRAGHANTEFGARFLSIAAATIVGEAASGGGVAKLVWPAIETVLCERLVGLADVFGASPKRDAAIHSLLMSTVLGVVVDASNYAVFGCGDGLVLVNGESTSLDAQTGQYLAERVLGGSDWRARLDAGNPAIAVHRNGPSAELKHLLIGTDGMEELHRRFGGQLAAFMGSEGAANAPGLSRAILPDFRFRVSRSPEVDEWARSQDGHDDRTFIVLRRLASPAAGKAEQPVEAADLAADH